MKGKLLVLEGSDASGKRTQSKLLVKRLKKEGLVAELVSFPRYSTLFGKLIGKYLSGGFGSIAGLPAEFPAMLYALDRYDAASNIEKKLKQGKTVVCDRYTASNIAHQGAKLSGKKQREFIEWIRALESKLPLSALTIYLDVPVGISQKLMKREGRKRDLHEKNIAYLKKVRAIYLQLARQKNWARINCVKKSKLLSIKEVHELIWKKVKRYL